ncbi:MAG: Structural maintenance of chromosomes protein 1 [Chrysothrix sp. TS-e1954]|nr:MAG: Structural maintenance of chromosomes protein 1 [Chrysothrix sp. TS-e1954]
MGKLVRLELYNFKSYKGHHVLLFGNSYFTSIIGPNGSGKSNSMDAISFVLGIKSSHLRSSHLRDLIYRGRILKTSKINADGTAAAPATAAEGDDADTQSSQRNDASSAWVMAVYEDDAGEEQRWKRTITTAGQSEYRINDRVVQAKQYNEALEDENILIKARNFLVFQGDVEAIASQSPKDLTRLVEQISGSLDYKGDYDHLEQESEKANEDQATKHHQRRGINAEIKQFSEQKKEADSYNRKADERDEAVVTHVLWKLYHLQQVIEESEAEMQRHQDEVKEHRRGVEKYEHRLEEAKKEQAKVGRDVSKSERSIKSIEKQIDDKQNELVPVDEKISISVKSREKYEKRVSEVEKERDAQNKGVEQLKKDLSIVQKAQTKWEQEFKSLAAKEGRQLSDNDVQEYNRLKTEVNKRAANSQIKVDNLTRQRRTDEETVNNLRSNVEESEKQMQKLQDDIDSLSERKSVYGSEAKQISNEIDAKKKEFNQIQSERLRSSQRHTELEEKLQQVLNKLSEADDGRRQSRKETQMRENLTAMKRLFPGIRGRVSELCKPKQKKYDVAVSTALGRNFDAIIVNTQKLANDCIDYARQQRIPRMDFIPLDTIQAGAVQTNLRGIHKKMRLAVDAVDYDSSLEHAVNYALGNAMICDDVETAKHLCYQKGIRAKAVTLNGTIIGKEGNLTGGRGPGDQSGRKFEDADVENLRKLKDKYLSDIEALPRGHKAATEEETIRWELNGLDQRLSAARDEVKALEKNLESKKKESSFIKKQLQETRPKYEEQSQSLQMLQQRIEENRTEVEAIENDIFAKFCKRLKYDSIQSYEAQQGSLQQEGAQKKLEFTTQRSKLENQLTFESQRLKTTSERIKTLDNQMKRDDELIVSLQEEKEIMQAELEEIDSGLDNVKSELDRHRDKYSERAEKVAEQRRELQKRSKDVDFLSKTITGMEAEAQRRAASKYVLLRKCKIDQVKLPLAQGSNDLDSLPVDNLLQGNADPDAMDVDEDEDSSHNDGVGAQDLGIEVDFDTLDEDLKEDDSDATQKDLERKIKALADELANLNPNMRAIERLGTATERLKTTDADFDATRRLARDTREAFEEVREKRAELFNKAFNHISEQIGPVYKALTRASPTALGGQAYLDTMGADDDAPFLGGLKYHAMPPSKRFRDMDALSGGEKTIAALALLFAVHSYAPSPFFVLDEVDAALDNANVAKVARYIREHAKPGMQFIVISLKTGLFQESECLVGVLRDQGANTSRAITLDLRKYQPN